MPRLAKIHSQPNLQMPRCVLINDAYDMAAAEGRFSDKKDEGEKLMSVWREDGVPVEGMNAETVKRYLHLARRLSSVTIKAQLMAWEMYEKRSTLVDSMTALRAVFGVSSDPEDPNLFTF